MIAGKTGFNSPLNQPPTTMPGPVKPYTRTLRAVLSFECLLSVLIRQRVPDSKLIPVERKIKSLQQELRSMPAPK